MSNEKFFTHPILNSPYDYPGRHWELDDDGQPTQQIAKSRRPVDFITPIPQPRRRGGRATQAELALGADVSKDAQQYIHASIINGVRAEVDKWRQLPQEHWRVSPETARLLNYWRTHEFSGIRPFFCQVEAVETAIWLTEVAPSLGKTGTRFLDHLKDANEEANPGLNRLALKLATGAGKTTVMAMLIAWQTINAVRHPNSRNFTRGFLVVTPGITIKDRLRVLQPSDPHSYYDGRELVPTDMMAEVKRAEVVITNYHAFKLREKVEISKGGRSLLQGRGEPLQTLETEGQMLQRVMPELMGMKNIMVLNDEAHHCYREKPESDEGTLTGDDAAEAKSNKEAARVWISGIEAVSRRLGVKRVMDLSATPFFLRGSGYVEGSLFPWTMCDFSLMDAIECGIVKLPRVPIASNLPSEEMPMYRDLWPHIRGGLPRGNRRNTQNLDPLSIPPQLQTALQALYGHYKETFELWAQRGIGVPPCFIIVCNNTATSKLVYDYISGFYRSNADGTEELVQGRLELFQNFDQFNQPLARPNTLLIDSEQLESGEALDPKFRKLAETEIEQFKREIIQRTGNRQEAENLSDAEILREVMNTVGKPGRLGEQIRCVVSVSMLTEGWDANTVTHVLGVRAFGTQLLCEQVIGRALRRQSYELNESGLFDVEYADVFGIPFKFNAEPVIAPPQPPRDTVNVRAVSPDQDAAEIRFPRIAGYRVELPEDRLQASFSDDSTMQLTPEKVGPTQVEDAAIIGERVQLTIEHMEEMRPSQIAYSLTAYIINHKWRGPDGEPQIQLFGQFKRIVRQWLQDHLECRGGTNPGLLMYQVLADEAAEKIIAGITRHHQDERPVVALPDPYNPVGSTRRVNFHTSRTDRWEPDKARCHLNWLIMDGGWESEFCRVVENHPRVRRYVKNHNLGFDVPYRHDGQAKRYRPDFIVHVDDGHGEDEPLNLIVEIKGYRGEDAKVKKETMETYWVPGVNHLGNYGRWAFAELKDVWGMEDDFRDAVARQFNDLIETVCRYETTSEY